MLTGRMIPEEAAAVLLPETRLGVVISLGEEGAHLLGGAGGQGHNSFSGGAHLQGGGN